MGNTNESMISAEMWSAFEQSAIWLDIKSTLEDRLATVQSLLMSESETSDLIKVRQLQQEIKDLAYFISFPTISIAVLNDIKEGRYAR